MKPLHLTTETQAVFTRIRTYGLTLNVYGRSHIRTWRLAKARTERRSNRAGVTLPYSNIYRRYVHELVEAFRTETGEPLISAFESVIRKWANLGLEPTLLQELLDDCFLRFEQQDYPMPRAIPLTRPRPRGPESGRRPRRSCEETLKDGRIALRHSSTVEEQSARSGEAERKGRNLSIPGTPY